jgi:hypothetical protein
VFSLKTHRELFAGAEPAKMATQPRMYDKRILPEGRLFAFQKMPMNDARWHAACFEVRA